MSPRRGLHPASNSDNSFGERSFGVELETKVSLATVVAVIVRLSKTDCSRTKSAVITTRKPYESFDETGR